MPKQGGIAGSPQEVPLPSTRKVGGLPEVKKASKTHPRRARRGG